MAVTACSVNATPVVSHGGPWTPTAPPVLGPYPPNLPSQQTTHEARVNASQQLGNPLVFAKGDYTADPKGAKK